LTSRPHKEVTHDLAHQLAASLELVQQVHPRAHHRIEAKSFALLGAGLIGASKVAQEFGTESRRERLKRVGDVGGGGIH